jgi:hypothetical protein
MAIDLSKVLCPPEKPFICWPYGKCYGTDQYCDLKARAVASCYPAEVSGQAAALTYCQQVAANVSELIHPTCRPGCEIIVAQAVECPPVEECLRCELWWAILLCSLFSLLVGLVLPYLGRVLFRMWRARHGSHKVLPRSPGPDAHADVGVADCRKMQNQTGRTDKHTDPSGGDAGSTDPHGSTRRNQPSDHAGADSVNQRLLNDDTVVAVGAEDQVAQPDDVIGVSVRVDELATQTEDGGAGRCAGAGDCMGVTSDPRSHDIDCGRSSQSRRRVSRAVPRGTSGALPTVPGNDSRPGALPTVPNNDSRPGELLTVPGNHSRPGALPTVPDNDSRRSSDIIHSSSHQYTDCALQQRDAHILADGQGGGGQTSDQVQQESIPYRFNNFNASSPDSGDSEIVTSQASYKDPSLRH